MSIMVVEVEQLVDRLQELGERIRRSELERYSSKLACRDAAQRSAIEAVTKAIVAELLHSPSIQLKVDTDTPSGQRNAEALRDLFDLIA